MTDKFIEFVGGDHQGIWVMCNETGDIYSSLSDAAKAFDVDVRRMSDHVLGRRGFVRGKYTFSIVQTPKYKSRKVLVHETGEVFQSISEAARVYNVSRTYLSKYIKKQWPVRGLTFKVLE